MATTLNANVITKDFDPKELTFTSVTTTSKSIEYAVDMTECKGPVDLIIDGSASETDVSLTVYGGSYPAAMADKVFTLTAGKCYTVSVSSGETMKTDGCLHIKLSSTASLVTLSMKLTAVERRYVTNH